LDQDAKLSARSTFHWQGETVRLILRFETQPHTPVSFAWLHGSHTLSRCRSTVCFALPVRGVSPCYGSCQTAG